ncbi:MAG: hypothetical protein R2751_00845 [Bacteroidales bacterium]
MSVLDFATYLSQYMRGLQGEDALLTSETIRFLLTGTPGYAMGWYNETDGDAICYHYGSEGSFYCHMMIYTNLQAAIVVFTNAPSGPDTEHFLNDARNYLKVKYIYNENQ